MAKIISSLRDRIAGARNRLYRVALAWTGDEMLADDLVQETIATGIKKSQQLRDEGKLYSWLYTILNNNWYKHLKKNKDHDDLDERLPCEESGPSTNCQELQIVYQVRHAISGLPKIERQVISLVDLEDCSYCEVAETLGIPIGTVMSRLYRARKNLLTRMERFASEPTNISRKHMHVVKS